MPATRYKEESTLRAWLKKQALLKGKAKRSNKTDPVVAPYMYFFYCLSDQEATIDEILKIIAQAQENKQEVTKILKAKKKRSTNLDEIWDEIRLESDAVSHEEIQDILAGTLFVMLNSLLWSMASRVKTRGGSDVPQAAGRKIGKTSLFELIRAAGNNFRHHEEWHGVISKNKQLSKNIAVLKAAGLKRPWNRNLCGEVFELTGWRNRKELSLEIRKLASEIFRSQTGFPL